MDLEIWYYVTVEGAECGIYNPDKNDLGGCIRQENRLESLENLDNWISPRLGIRFQLAQPELLLYYPDGQPFTSYNQERQRAEVERQRAERLAAKLRELNINPEEI